MLSSTGAQSEGELRPPGSIVGSTNVLAKWLAQEAIRLGAPNNQQLPRFFSEQFILYGVISLGFSFDH